MHSLRFDTICSQFNLMNLMHAVPHPCCLVFGPRLCCRILVLYQSDIPLWFALAVHGPACSTDSPFSRSCLPCRRSPPPSAAPQPSWLPPPLSRRAACSRGASWWWSYVLFKVTGRQRTAMSLSSLLFRSSSSPRTRSCHAP